MHIQPNKNWIEKHVVVDKQGDEKEHDSNILMYVKKKKKCHEKESYFRIPAFIRNVKGSIVVSL